MSLLLRIICESVDELASDVARFEDKGDLVRAMAAGRRLGQLTALRDALAGLTADDVAWWQEQVRRREVDTQHSIDVFGHRDAWKNYKPQWLQTTASAPAIRALLAALREEG